MRIGIDSGGTFTDFAVLHDDGRLESFKLRSSPASPASVILAGIARAVPARTRADLVHGSTVATNALLERKGAKTAFVTTRGFEDLIAIGRQNRPELYNLTPFPARPLVAPDMCFGVDERILFDGAIERPLQPGNLAERLAGAESVAICLLHSYQNDAHERALLEALRGSGAYVCASCDVSPEFREFERASTTVINAYVGPLMDRFGPYRVIMALFMLGGAFLFFTGLGARSVAWVATFMAFVATGSVSGIQKCINALMIFFYPTALRSTGLGWAFGDGRFGAMIGPVCRTMPMTCGPSRIPAMISPTTGGRWQRRDRDGIIITIVTPIISRTITGNVSTQPGFSGTVMTDSGSS